MSDIGQAIKAARAMRGMTQDQVAKAAGMTRPFISKVEVGKTVPVLETIFRIADALDVEAWKLVRQASRYRGSRKVQIQVSSLTEGSAGVTLH